MAASAHENRRCIQNFAAHRILCSRPPRSPWAPRRPSSSWAFICRSGGARLKKAGGGGLIYNKSPHKQMGVWAVRRRMVHDRGPLEDQGAVHHAALQRGATEEEPGGTFGEVPCASARGAEQQASPRWIRLRCVRQRFGRLLAVLCLSLSAACCSTPGDDVLSESWSAHERAVYSRGGGQVTHLLSYLTCYRTVPDGTQNTKRNKIHTHVQNTVVFLEIETTFFDPANVFLSTHWSR